MNTQKNIVSISELTLKDRAYVGGKASSLGELCRAGANVPQGFVITTKAWGDFIAENQLQEAIVSILVSSKSVQQKSQTLRELIVSCSLSKSLNTALQLQLQSLACDTVSVRSSATAEDNNTAAWAGQLDTFLGIKKSLVSEHVLACWASLFTERALIYAQERGVDIFSIRIAVVIQSMISAESAGVGFSVHPLTQEKDCLLIQSSFGIGESVMSGAVTPDQWVFNKKNNQLLEKQISEKRQALLLTKGKVSWQTLKRKSQQPSLTDKEATEYAKILAKLEKYYGHPIDTEWAYANRIFYLLQARPVTTLDADYRLKLYNEKYDWKRLVKRPFSYLAATCILHCLQFTHGTIQRYAVPTVEVEVMPNLIYFYQPPAEIEKLYQAADKAFQKNPARFLGYFEEGFALINELHPHVERKSIPFQSVQEMYDVMVKVVRNTVQLPWIFMDIFSKKASLTPDEGKAFHYCEQLRAQSLYSWFYDEVLPELLPACLKELGLENIKNPLQCIAIDDLLVKEVNKDAIWARVESVQAGKRFLLNLEKNKISTYFLSDTGFVIMRLNKMRIKQLSKNENELHGTTAYPGLVEGVARVIFKANANTPFNPGDILVSINANPSLMPYIKQCSAIVAGEGGNMCHAAIIAREMKIPCLMSVTDVTLKIKDGQRIRVDAFNQTVTLL